MKRRIFATIVDSRLRADSVRPGGATILWPLTDNLGSVRDLVNNSGTVQNHITYGAFGQITSETAAAVDHIFGFAGRERDDESLLDYNRARYYDSSTGRFLGEDPSSFLAGDTNLNRYTFNSPTNFTDPSGLTVDDPGPNNDTSFVPVLSGLGGDPGDKIPVDLTPKLKPFPSGAFDPGFGPFDNDPPPFIPIPDVDLWNPLDPNQVFTGGELPDFGLPAGPPSRRPPRMRPGIFYDPNDPSVSTLDTSASIPIDLPRRDSSGNIITDVIQIYTDGFPFPGDRRLLPRAGGSYDQNTGDWEGRVNVIITSPGSRPRGRPQD